MINTVEKNLIIADFQRGLSNRQIAKNHGHSRTTIVQFRKKYDEALNSEDSVGALSDLISAERVPSKRNRSHTKLSSEIMEIIDKCLSNNEVKKASGRRKMVQMGTDIHEEVLRAGYSISYRTINRYIKSKLYKQAASAKKCFIRQNYIPGERMEFDWGEVKIYIEGKLCVLNMAVVSLGCNARWARLSTRQDKLALMEAHIEAFKFFGAVPQIMVYDNMKTAVASFTLNGKEPTRELTQLEAYYGFKHLFCNVRSGNEKPHVERGVDDVRRKAFAGNDNFNSFDEANDYLLEFCRTDNQTVGEAFEKELRVMKPVGLPYACFEAFSRQVTKESLFQLDTNEYSVPYQYVGKEVWVKKYSDKIVVYDNNNMTQIKIAEHRRLHKRNEESIQLEHYLDVLLIKPGALNRSVALEQASDAVKDLYNKYFVGKNKEFIEMLIWARENNHSTQDLYSASLLANTKGIKEVTFPIIKAILNEDKELDGVVNLPWSEKIEELSSQNLKIISSMFNSTNNITAS